MKMEEKEPQLPLEEGEVYRIEFKETFSGLDKEMVAFTNAYGGRIFLGIADDNKIMGIRSNNKIKFQLQL